jgi:hypothetical protein
MADKQRRLIGGYRPGINATSYLIDFSAPSTARSTALPPRAASKAGLLAATGLAPTLRAIAVLYVIHV